MGPGIKIVKLAIFLCLDDAVLPDLQNISPVSKFLLVSCVVIYIFFFFLGISLGPIFRN